MTLPSSYHQLQSTVQSSGQLHVGFVQKDMPTPPEGFVIVRVEATPINPSDIWTVFSAADLRKAEVTGTGFDSVLTAPIIPEAMPNLAVRMDKPLPVGNEGAGTIMASGGGDMADALVGKTVAFAGGMLYGEYCCVPAMVCMPLAEGQSAKDGASAFVNPMTALAMVETMKAEGHKALMHTAAASNLGQMLNRICIEDGIELVNIVRKDVQSELLKSIGAKHVVNSSNDDFIDQLTEAAAATGATLAFDATGGGKLADSILSAMEGALLRKMDQYSPYGSPVHKQVYLYGGLDITPTTLSRRYGMHWGVGGFLLTTFLNRTTEEVRGRMRARVLGNLTTTFKSNYTGEIALTDILDPSKIALYYARATGQKYLVTPSA